MNKGIIFAVLCIFLFAGIGFADVTMDVALNQNNVYLNTSICPGATNVVNIKGNITAANNRFYGLLRFWSQEMTAGSPVLRWTTGEIWDIDFDTEYARDETSYNVSQFVTTDDQSGIGIAEDLGGWTKVDAVDDDKFSNKTYDNAFNKRAFICYKTESCHDGTTLPLLVTSGMGTLEIPTGSYHVYVRGVCNATLEHEYNVSINGGAERRCSDGSADNTTFIWFDAGTATLTDAISVGIYSPGEFYSVVDAIILINAEYDVSKAWPFDKSFAFTTGTGLFYENTLYGFDFNEEDGSEVDTDVLYVWADPSYNAQTYKCPYSGCNTMNSTLLWFVLAILILGLMVAIIYTIPKDLTSMGIAAAVVIVLIGIIAAIFSNFCAV